MVVPLGPGKFYGSSLPRPRIYTDIKFNDYRVDPPISVTDPLMSWANEAHWSMGGLSFNRHRLQGRIEGNIQKLRTEREKVSKKRAESEIPSPPAAPMAVKRKRRVVDEEEEEDGVVVKDKERKKKTARKLKDEFDLVATRKSPVKVVQNEEAVLQGKTRKSPVKAVREEVGVVERVVESGNGGRELRIGRRLVKGAKVMREEARVVASGKRMSPRLVKSLFT